MNHVDAPDVLSLQGFVQSIVRHKLKVLLSFAIMLTLICTYTVNRGRNYESTSKLFVRKGKETATIDPIAEASGRIISVTDTQDREINSIVSILVNRDLLEQVVDDVEPETILNFQDDDDPPGKSSAKLAISSMIADLKNSIRLRVWLLEMDRSTGKVYS